MSSPSASPDLASVIVQASSVRPTRVGELDPRHRGLTTLLIESEPVALMRLVEALAIDPESMVHQIALMIPGVLDLHFFRGHELIATVTYLAPAIIRWAGWP